MLEEMGLGLGQFVYICIRGGISKVPPIKSTI